MTTGMHTDLRTTSGEDWAMLQEATVSLVALSAVARQLYWSASGANRGRLQLMFEGVSDTAQTDADSVAERLATVGGRPNYRPDAVAVAAQAFLDFSAEATNESVAIEAIRRTLASVGRDVERVRSVVGARDPVTDSVLAVVADDLTACAILLWDNSAASAQP